MASRINEIIEKNDETGQIKDFSSIKLSQSDLEYLNRTIGDGRVHFINWHPEQQIPVTLKADIYNKLSENML